MNEKTLTPAFLLRNRAHPPATPAETNATGAAPAQVAPAAPAPEATPEYAIPTLNSVALPETSDDVDVRERPTFEPVLIGSGFTGLNLSAPPPETQLSGEDIRRIVDLLRETLIPEVEKTAAFAMNHAFALAMDQASHMLRQRVHAKLDELLPKLVEDAIKNPPRKP
jgi:hypothetical protein